MAAKRTVGEYFDARNILATRESIEYNIQRREAAARRFDVRLAQRWEALDVGSEIRAQMDGIETVLLREISIMPPYDRELIPFSPDEIRQIVLYRYNMNEANLLRGCLERAASIVSEYESQFPDLKRR